METACFGNGWEGRVVEGRFPLLERLGGTESCASFRTVLQGLQEALIQLILPGGAEVETYIAQWDFAKGLSHPHLAKVLAEGRCVIDRNDLVYVVTERPYATLAMVIKTRTLKADSARETFAPVLDALSYLHKNGVVHGHVNPSNIQIADMKPKLSVTDLLIADSVKRGISSLSNYDAPELMHGIVTAAADMWSVGMSLCEAMTEALPFWDPSKTEDPEVMKSLPSPFREIVQDCLRVDPLRRCSIESILKRLDESKSIPISDDPIPVKIDKPLHAATPIPKGETPIRYKPGALPFPAEGSLTEESSAPVLFSRSLTHFEDPPLSRLRVMPYVVVVLAVVAVISVLLILRHKSETLRPVASRDALASSPPAAEKQSAAPTPSASNQTEAATTPGVSQPKPDVAAQPQPDATPQAETPSAPSPEQPAPPASEADHALVREKTEGLVAKRVLPSVSPGARAGMRRPVGVVIRVSVNKDGTVSDAAYVSPGPGNYFARLAQRAALSWRFKPPRRNGDAQRSVWTLRFIFDRENTNATVTQAEN